MSQTARHEPPATNTDAPADPESVARTILLRRLTDQPRSRAELAGFLAKKHVPDDVAEKVLDRFEEVGLIDDEEFARSWVQSRQRSRGIASKVLAMELRRKGIDDDTSREVLADLDPEVERQNAHRLVQKKLRSMRGPRLHHPDPAAHRHARPQGIRAAGGFRRRAGRARGHGGSAARLGLTVQSRSLRRRSTISASES